MLRRTLLKTAAGLAAGGPLLRSGIAGAQATPGVSATEITIGNTVPYSGSASSYGVTGRVESAFFKMVNDAGGIAGRKINFVSLDDGYSPPKTVEQTRRLVEQEQVAFMFASIGTPTNTAVHKYLNQHKVPQLLILTGADTVLLFAYAKQAAQAIRKIYELNWQPDTYLHSGSASMSATLIPAGLERCVGIKTARYMKDPSDPRWRDDPELKPFYEWLKEYMPTANSSDTFFLSGWTFSQMLVQVLKQCGDDLTRENIMRQAANLKDFRNPGLLPGSLINTSPTDYRVVKFMTLERFNGKNWESVAT